MGLRYTLKQVVTWLDESGAGVEQLLLEVLPTLNPAA